MPCVKRGIRDGFEGVHIICLCATRPPITLDDIHISLHVDAIRGISYSCRLAPALIYSCTVADARDEESSPQRTPPTSGTHDRRADAHTTRKVSGCSRTTSTEGCLQIGYFQFPVPCYPALCGFVFRTDAWVWKLDEEYVKLEKVRKKKL